MKKRNRREKTRRREFCLLPIVMALLVLLPLLAAAVTKADEGPVPVSTTVTGFSEARHNGETGLEWTRLHIDSAGRLWSFQTEFDLGGLDNDSFEDSRILKTLWSGRKFGEWDLRLGRVFLAAGYSTPAPGLYKTSAYPNVFPWGFYAYGVQTNRMFGEWGLRADVTGQSGLSFQESGQFDRVEGSLRITHPLPHNGSVGFSAQGFDGAFRGGLDFRLGQVSGGVFHDASTDDVTGWLLVDHSFSRWLSGHVMGEQRVDGETVGTLGVGLGNPSRLFYLAGGLETTGDVILRLQLRLPEQRW